MPVSSQISTHCWRVLRMATERAIQEHVDITIDHPTSVMTWADFVMISINGDFVSGLKKTFSS